MVIRNTFCDIKKHFEMHSEYAHQQRPVSATLFRFHIECYMYTGHIKLFVVLGNLTDLCLIGHGFIQKSFQENKKFGSRSDRRLTQVGTELKGFVFRMGYAASLARLLMRGSRIFYQLGGGGRGVQAQLTQKSYFYIIIYNILVLIY